jgi:hypothetical protein
MLNRVDPPGAERAVAQPLDEENRARLGIPGPDEVPVSECTRKFGSTVRTADTSDWPAT